MSLLNLLICYMKGRSKKFFGFWTFYFLASLEEKNNNCQNYESIPTYLSPTPKKCTFFSLCLLSNISVVPASTVLQIDIKINSLGGLSLGLQQCLKPDASVQTQNNEHSSNILYTEHAAVWSIIFFLWRHFINMNITALGSTHSLYSIWTHANALTITCINWLHHTFIWDTILY